MTLYFRGYGMTDMVDYNAAKEPVGSGVSAQDYAPFDPGTSYLNQTLNPMVGPSGLPGNSAAPAGSDPSDPFRPQAISGAAVVFGIVAVVGILWAWK